jgi:hypothetical protein
VRIVLRDRLLLRVIGRDAESALLCVATFDEVLWCLVRQALYERDLGVDDVFAIARPARSLVALGGVTELAKTGAVRPHHEDPIVRRPRLVLGAEENRLSVRRECGIEAERRVWDRSRIRTISIH